jgi:hypothetical protein
MIMKVDKITLGDFKNKTSEICNLKYDDFVNTYIESNKDVKEFVLPK